MSGGQVSLSTGSSADAQVQIIGYMPTGGAVTAPSPVRLLDTRTMSTAFAAGEQRDITVAGAAGVPSGPGAATDVLAVVTSVSTTASGSLTIWDTGGSAASAPSMRWNRTPFAQFVILHLGAGGAVTVKNTSTSTSTHLLVDIYGYFT